jgi:hypothetical protein
MGVTFWLKTELEGYRLRHSLWPETGGYTIMTNIELPLVSRRLSRNRVPGDAPLHREPLKAASTPRLCSPAKYRIVQRAIE